MPSENPAPLPPRIVTRAYPITDVWFQSSNEGCRLMMATDEPGVEAEIDVQMAGGVTMRLRHVTNIKGRRVFEATEWRPADGAYPSPQLNGPFRAGPEDVA